jgi:hypothetical protein
VSILSADASKVLPDRLPQQQQHERARGRPRLIVWTLSGRCDDLRTHPAGGSTSAASLSHVFNTTRRSVLFPSIVREQFILQSSLSQSSFFPIKFLFPRVVVIL